MFDRLWDESPMVQNMKKQSRDEGEVQGVRRSLMKYVQRKFPELTELAQAKSKLVHDFDALEALYEQIQDATSANVVQQFCWCQSLNNRISPIALVTVLYRGKGLD